MWYYLKVTKRQKRKERIRNNPTNVRFEDLDRLLLDYEFTRGQPGGGSSHYIYARQGLRITIPMHRPHLKEIYVRNVLKLLDEIDNE